MPYLPFMEQAAPDVFRFNENSWLLRWLQGMNISTNMAVHNTARWLKLTCPHTLHVNPAYDSLLVTCPQWQAVDAVDAFIKKAFSSGNVTEAGHNSDSAIQASVNIPVCYDPGLSNDLEKVSAHCGMAIEDIIGLHTGVTYQVFMNGFLPGFAYMGQTDERIDMPRKKTPELTRAGAVGIAGRQTGIYPLDSPGGWHILGYTPLRMFDIRREIPVLLEPGMKVRFNAISVDRFNTMLRP